MVSSVGWRCVICKASIQKVTYSLRDDSLATPTWSQFSPSWPDHGLFSNRFPSPSSTYFFCLNFTSYWIKHVKRKLCYEYTHTVNMNMHDCTLRYSSRVHWPFLSFLSSCAASFLNNANNHNVCFSFYISVTRCIYTKMKRFSFSSPHLQSFSMEVLCHTPLQPCISTAAHRVFCFCIPSPLHIPEEP